MASTRLNNSKGWYCQEQKKLLKKVLNMRFTNINVYLHNQLFLVA